MIVLLDNQLIKQVVERALQAELSHHLDVDSATGNAKPVSNFGYWNTAESSVSTLLNVLLHSGKSIF